MSTTTPLGTATATSGGLVGLLAGTAARRPDGVALRYKRRGLWRSVTWAVLQEQVLATAGGLRAAGVGPGDAVAVLGDASPGWVVADLAVQALGGRSVALPAQTVPDVAVRALARCGVRLVVAGSAAEAALVLGAGAELGPVPVVVVDPTGCELLPAADGRLRSLADLQAAGATAGPVEAAGGSATVTVFTDGTGGDPEPADLAAPAVAEVALGCARWLGVTASDRTLSILSPATPAARVLDLYVPLATGSELALAESPATVPVDLAEAEPTHLCVSPRALALLRGSSTGRADRSSPLRARVYRWATAALDDRLDRVPAARTVEGARRGRGLAHAVVGHWVARDLGLRRTRRVVVTGGPAGRADLRFLWSLGVAALEVHGPAAAAGLALAHDGLDTSGSAGRPLPGAQAEVDERSLLRVRTPLTAPGWAETGEVASTDAGTGALRVHGPAAERIGDVHPGEVEAALRDCPHVRRALVVADRDGTAAVVEIDPDAVGRWAVAHDVPATTFAALAAAPQVRELVEREVARAAPVVGRVVLSPRPWSAGSGDLTPLLAVRRAAVSALLGE